MDRMTDEYADDVTFRTMREGDIVEEAGGCFDGANEPERISLVLDMSSSLDSLGLLGGRDAIREWVARLSVLVEDDAAWT